MCKKNEERIKGREWSKTGDGKRTEEGKEGGREQERNEALGNSLGHVSTT